MQKEKNIGIIMLAAGASSRLGRPKQLLPYTGKTLLQHSIQTALDSVADTVIVVIGAHEGQVRKETDWNGVQTVTNTDWQEGMASSIRCGIGALIRANPQIEGAVLMLCDQPYVTADLLNDLITGHQQTGKAIIASSYNNTIGVPALFDKSIFPQLIGLKGDVGARAIIQQHINDTQVVIFPGGSVDIDTPGDYEELKQ